MKLADRMKLYEGRESKRRLIPKLPVIARLDGRSFHSFTKGLGRPYSKPFLDLMFATTIHLVTKTKALVGYTQSDEISLVFYSDDVDSQIFFDSRIFKMVSILASMCTLDFNKRLPNLLPRKQYENPMFDCRVWSVPDKQEVVNYLLWREQDATRNSIQMAAQSLYSHKQLHKKNTGDLQDMLMEKGVNWNDYPYYCKRGQYVQRKKVTRKFTTNELELLPPKHQAFSDPDLTVERHDVLGVELPPISTVTNMEDVIFNGDNVISL